MLPVVTTGGDPMTSRIDRPIYQFLRVLTVDRAWLGLAAQAAELTRFRDVRRRDESFDSNSTWGAPSMARMAVYDDLAEERLRIYERGLGPSWSRIKWSFGGDIVLLPKTHFLFTNPLTQSMLGRLAVPLLTCGPVHQLARTIRASYGLQGQASPVHSLEC